MIKFVLLIFFSLAIASFLALCIMTFTNLRFKSKNKKLQELDSLLDLLIRRKVLEFGFLSNFKKQKVAEDQALVDKCKTLKVLEFIILRNKESGKVNSSSLLAIYAFLNNIHERKITKLKDIKRALEKHTRCQISDRFILEKSRVLLSSDTFMLDEAQKKFMSLREISSVIVSYTYVALLSDDAIKGDSTVTKVIERMRNTSCKQVFKCIEYLFLLKAGAGSKILMDEIILKQNFDVSRLKRMGELQKHNAIMSFIRNGYREYKKIQEIVDEILITLKKMNKLRNEHLNKHFKEDKRQEDRRNKERNDKRRKEQEEGRKQERRQKARAQSEERRQKQNKREQKIFVGGVELTNAYETLGVDPNCSIRKIKKSYKHLAMKKHPDRMTDNDSVIQNKKAHDEFIEIKNAYDKLIKHHKKAA